MLVIDSQMLNLARMQEAVLRKSTNDKESNLEKYKGTVIKIDAVAFDSILSELEQFDQHNQTLEEELQYLEQIKDSYNQLLELQCSFKRVCELFGDNYLKLSDLSQINSEYIENRVNVINGYLITIKNLEINKNKLQELNIELIDEEKKKRFFREKMLDFEESLRKQFLDAEGRVIEDGKHIPTSVILEYKKLGYDFEKLLFDASAFNEIFMRVTEENNEMEDKLRTAEICYNSAPNKASKQVYDEITIEYLNFKYKLTLLKILKLLMVNSDNYDIFREKREKILDLIKYRGTCLGKLGIKFSIDPFDRVKILDQFDVLPSVKDNSNNVNRIKKEIVQLSEIVDEMESQKNEYMVQLNNSENLILDKVSMNDINISNVSWDVKEFFTEAPVVMDNQVVAIIDLPTLFNLHRARQKANLVVVRVNDMHNRPLIVEENKDEVVPELVIVHNTTLNDDNAIIDNDKNLTSSLIDEPIDFVNPLFDMDEDMSEDVELVVPNIMEELENLEQAQLEKVDSNIFETVVPFEETTLFVDKVDEPLVIEKDDASGSLSSKELMQISNKKEEELDLYLDMKDETTDEELPDAFWITVDEDSEIEENDNFELSFDEQINALLNNEDVDLEDKDTIKVRKLGFAKKDNLKNVA